MARRWGLAAAFVIALRIASTGFAQDLVTEIASPPPTYNILRFQENYSYLSNPAKRSDGFDSLKYIPLWPGDPTWYLTLSGELRERYEGASNPGFGIRGDSNEYWLQRVRISADFHFGDHVRLYVEGISGLEAGETLPPPPSQKDPADLQFAFLEFIPYLTADERFSLRVGRYGMSLGSGRLVAARAAPNIPFKFDGFELLYNAPTWHATAFLNHPVNELLSFDKYDHTVTFWGIYATRWFDALRKDGVDLYYLGIKRDEGSYVSGVAREVRHSLGSRIFGEKNHWDWNGEAVIQFGTFGKDSILAWTASLDTGYTFDAPWAPRLGIKLDVASGDRNQSDGQQGTFDALFFKSGYFNDASLLRPENIIDIHPNLTIKPNEAISIDGGIDWFWRYSRNDGIYSPAGQIQIPANPNAPLYLGPACDVNFEWRIQRHVTFTASYVHFFAGQYIHAAGGGDVDYVSATLSFIF